MDLTPLHVSGSVIQIHAYAALVALVLGTAVLLRRKGDSIHKVMGRIWVATMAVVALSSFLIAEIRLFGPYSWIHILSAITLVTLVRGVAAIRRGRVAEHKASMIALYGLALVLTGAFTLLPGRRMHAVIFADGGTSAALAALAAAALIGAALAVKYRRRA